MEKIFHVFYKILFMCNDKDTLLCECHLLPEKRYKLFIILYFISALIGIFTVDQQYVYANDSTAEIGMGGIQFIKEENISIEREDLLIDPERIEVAYWFKIARIKILLQ